MTDNKKWDIALLCVYTLYSPRDDFTNVLQAAFAHAGPKSAKRHWWLDCLFCALGFEHVKALLK